MLIMLPFSSAPAAQHLVMNSVAYHFENRDERRMLTPGIGWEFSPSKKVGYHLGTLSDSFGSQAGYLGFNWATRRFPLGSARVRVLLGATVVHKQFHKNSAAETKVIPFPVLEFGYKRVLLNVSGSPKLDVAGQRNNAVIFLQLKWNTLLGS